LEVEIGGLWFQVSLGKSGEGQVQGPECEPQYRQKKKVQIPLPSVLDKQLHSLYKWQIRKPLKSDFFFYFQKITSIVNTLSFKKKK
jgi:hypothetical protein